jgi:2-oxo-4-hydroxy-4-carboxy-5-ureidoimidazoline decarboxylase
MSAMHTLEQINAMDADGFVDAFGGIYEHSPWVARKAEQSRPYATLEQLHAAMKGAVAAASESERLALIRSHPELLGKLAPMEKLTADSLGEQMSAGLDQCSPEELAQLKALNHAYREKFGFPFVVAVRGLTRSQIIERLGARAGNTQQQEFAACLAEIDKIANLRLQALVQ